MTCSCNKNKNAWEVRFQKPNRSKHVLFNFFEHSLACYFSAVLIFFNLVKTFGFFEFNRGWDSLGWIYVSVVKNLVTRTPISWVFKWWWYLDLRGWGGGGIITFEIVILLSRFLFLPLRYINFPEKVVTLWLARDLRWFGHPMASALSSKVNMMLSIAH